MAVTDNYKELKSKDMQMVFTKLYSLKGKAKAIKKEIEDLEALYKPEIKKSKKDLFYVLPSGIQFSIKKSIRSGNIDTNALELDGINIEKYRKPDSDVWTLRYEEA